MVYALNISFVPARSLTGFRSCAATSARAARHRPASRLDRFQTITGSLVNKLKRYEYR